jgi:amino acid adenylation domain-containing protein
MKKNLIDFFDETVENFPDEIALLDEDKKINFIELQKKSKILSTHIINLTNFSNKPIAVFLPKSIESVIANISIIYSCNIFMNIDVKNPLERIKNVFDLIQPEIIITDSFFIEILKDIIDNNKVLIIDKVNFDIELDDKLINDKLKSQIDTDPLCIINTSGSEGTPKGVVLNHRSFIEFTQVSLDTFSFSSHEIIGSTSPNVFDIYIYELCLLIIKGYTLLLIPEKLMAFPFKILELLNHHKVSFIFWVPTLMVNIANMNLFNDIRLPSLKMVWFAGEVFPTKQFNYWKKNLKHSLFANLYGPIEITLDCTYFIINREFADDEPIPIGFPFKNTDVFILNENNQLIDGDEEGELCVRGTSLAMGYYNNTEKTSQVFVQNPLNKSYPELIYRTGDIVTKNKNGEIIFKGRKDTLIKHLGYRIELGEIEHIIINVIKLIDNGCVVYNKAKKEISLIYESKIEISITDLRKKIGEHLPKYMVPVKYIRMSELPMNTNGKIDRLFLNNKINQ